MLSDGVATGDTTSSARRPVLRNIDARPGSGDLQSEPTNSLVPKELIVLAFRADADSTNCLVSLILSMVGTL